MLVRQRQKVQEVPRGVSPAGIELHDLAKSYGPIEAVRGIDVSIAPGETVALLGPNGAGKSTTIDMLLGLTRPDRGTVADLRRAAERGGRRAARSARCCRRARSSAISTSAS